MNLDEAVPDHRVELLQKWMADPKLMAQAGLLGSNSAARNEVGDHLGVDWTKNTHAVHNKEHGEKLKHWISKASGDGEHSHKKKKNKKNKGKSGEELLKAWLHTFGATDNHVKPKKNKKQNQVNNLLKQTSEALDHDLTENINHYKTAVEKALADDLVGFHSKLPEGEIKKALKISIDKVQAFYRGQSGNGFDATFISIKDWMLRTIAKKSPLADIKAIKYSNYAYPPYFDDYGPRSLRVMLAGFLVHEIITMLTIHLERNVGSERYKSNPQIRPLLKDLHKYKRDYDRHYTHLTSLKIALEVKVKEHRKKGESIKHIVNKSLEGDAEEELHHDSAFHMGQPFEDY